MTAGAFANLLQARQSGRNQWLAQRPAHDDSDPSLSIGEGRDGNVLICCHAGCKLRDILAQVGLSVRDLYTPESDEQRSAREQRQRADGRRKARLRKLCGDAADDERHFSLAVDYLGRQLATAGDSASSGEELAEQFHQMLNALRAAEAKCARLLEMSRPRRRKAVTAIHESPSQRGVARAIA